MKFLKILSVCACAFALIATPALADDKPKAAEKTCCEKAKAEGKECSHKCCVAARSEKKVCEKCNPGKAKKEESSKEQPKKD